MNITIRIFLTGIVFLFFSDSFAQKINVSGKVTGPAAKVVKEVQFISDGRMQSLTLNKDDQSFSGNIKILTPQFVEIKSGNTRPQFFYLIPNEKLTIAIDKPSLQESIVTLTNNKITQLQGIFDSYFTALKEKGIDPKARDWQKLLFDNNEPVAFAETRLNEQLKKNAALISAVPNFKADVLLFISAFRSYTDIDKMLLPEIEAALENVKKANVKKTALNIPFFKDYLTDLTNAYAARTLGKYGITIDVLKQKNISQFIAAEALTKYISDSSIKSYIFSEKLRIELAVNGLKNEAFVSYLLSNSQQFVKDFYKEKIVLLTENKTPDMNAARKKAFNFLLKDADGKEYRLADFKGKMLFIDFWASWCVPCKAQIPYQKELEKNYAGKDIIFASVSLDKSKEAWLKAVKDEDLHGYVMHAEGDFKNEFPKAYGVESIPRYMLIDANGNIISDNMMKPQNKKEIMGLFDGELYAKNTISILEKHFEAIGAEGLKKSGMLLEYSQSLVGLTSKSKLYYSYPDKMKNLTKFEETEQMLMILGKDFFNEKYTVINGDKFATNNPGMANVKKNWFNKINGFELFLKKSVNNVVVTFAEENTSNNDNCFVLKLVNNGDIEKYYINKTTYFIDKVTTLTTNVEPRNGGGFIESFTKYEDYRNVNGVMIPFKINYNNIVNIKVEKAEVKPITNEIFEQ